jgi:hypothetical protein
MAEGVLAAEMRPTAPGLGELGVLELTTASADSSELPLGLSVWIGATRDPKLFELRPLRVGKVGVALAGGDTLWWEVPSSIEEARPELLRPIKSVGSIGPNWWPTLAVVLAILLPALWWLRQKMRRPTRSRTAFPIPPEPPHRRALRRLDALAASDMLPRGAFASFYVEGSHTLREYVQGRFRVPALDWTSAELIERMKEAGYRPEDIQFMAPLLGEADTVKFAGDRPSDHGATRWLEEIRDFVEHTAVEMRFSTPEALAAAEQMTGAAR